ncbi:branched-chain amino acid ABC transporter permease [Anaeromyxobacter diazotrophicus]|uniref:Branched-chain amino acid ABC transporter permease n=1 Tax=Anaeromyxobacter diazotrophicus TaxID=2590199 RepID=A0A7I9VJW7_9BACT|nr:branched-chain amino acid ABC transporter permease [Anaeromyxobacter diazotrophicus]GEJ56479.1 branched-chain amino acid ABC transporter permease [Anaeromyxobacter diazotrophicus]
MIVHRRHLLYSLAAGAVLAAFLFVADTWFDAFTLRVLNLCAIYVVLALSLNLVNGFTGLFSLGHAGFMAVGAYTSALLTMTPEQKEVNFFLEPIAPWLAHLHLPFLPALVAAGLVAALLGFLLGAPVLRLKDDYLAIATLGFAEIIRVVLTNTQNITNGALGLKGLPAFASTWVVWGCAALSAAFMAFLVRSSYGRALKAVRDDEIAAGAMGIDVFRVKVVSFTASSFMAGVGGALLGHVLTTIDPKMFTFMLTFSILLIVVLGGIGSITGSIAGAIGVTILMELLRFLDGPIDLGVVQLEARPGLRMVVFSILLMAVVLFRQRGLMGNREFSWSLFSRAGLWPRSGRGKHGLA